MESKEEISAQEQEALAQIWEKETWLLSELDKAKAEAGQLVADAKAEAAGIVSAAKKAREITLKASQEMAVAPQEEVAETAQPTKAAAELEREELARLSSVVRKNSAAAVTCLVDAILPA